jgi:serine/threonine-protein kinase
VSNTDDPDKPSPPPPDPGATVILTPEEVERLRTASAAARTAPTGEDPLIGTLIRDKWRVLERLGAGSFGTVYKVQDVTGGWIEALKILGVDRLTGAEADQMRARFLREAQIMKRLGKDSRHIVGLSTYEEDFESGLVYFLMEFVEGRSLGDALGAEGPFPPDRVVRLAAQVCEALIVAHEGPEPVVHRDLKLENLMLTRAGAGEEIVKVLDFGIAKIAERDADSRLTTVGTLGTPGYAAPEQLRAEPVDARTDLFAFGVILYALLSGRDPWLGNLAHESTTQIYELMVATDRAEVRPLVAPAPIPPALTAVVMRLLSREPADRFQSARELRDVLLRIASGQAPATAPVAAKPAVTSATAPAPPSTTKPDGPVRPAGGDRPHASSRPGAPSGRADTAQATAPKPRSRPRRRGRAGRILFLLLLVGAGGATGWARPWGRTLDATGLMTQVEAGNVSALWFNEAGLEGGLRLVPVEAAADLLVPFAVPVPVAQRRELTRRLRDAGVAVDVSWELHRLMTLAASAQDRARYFDDEDDDVRALALQMLELEPTSLEAAALLRKVAERMAWDAESALAEGQPEVARELLEACLDLVDDHPRCLGVSATLS